jgi:hypothetical protein
VKVKLLSAKNLSRQDYSLLSLGVGGRLGLGSGPEISPYMCFSVGSRSHSTSAVRGSCNPSWKKESFSVPLRKGDFEDGAPVILGVEGKETQTIVESVMPSTIKGDKSLGVGAVDVTNVVLGDADLVDTWISLSHGGSVHVLVGYEPHGIEPAKGDVVALEAFARNEGNLVLGKDDPLKVLDSAGNYLHCSYRMGGGRLGAVKVHRNSVFVIERLVSARAERSENIEAKGASEGAREASAEEGGPWAAREPAKQPRRRCCCSQPRRRCCCSQPRRRCCCSQPRRRCCCSKVLLLAAARRCCCSQPRRRCCCSKVLLLPKFMTRRFPPPPPSLSL